MLVGSPSGQGLGISEDGGKSCSTPVWKIDSFRHLKKNKGYKLSLRKAMVKDNRGSWLDMQRKRLD